MRKFTLLSKMLPIALLVLGAFLSPQQAKAQTHVLNVTAPGDVAGEYLIQVASFGPLVCDTEGLAGDFEIAIDGSGTSTSCDTVTNDMTGKIAIIDRGNCDFSTKVFNAQQRGAIAVIVCDNVQGSTEYVNMGPGVNADMVTIPSFFMLNGDCEAIKPFIGDGFSASIERNAVADGFDGVVLYEETFCGGLGEWTTNVITCGNGSSSGAELWRWQEDGTIVDPCGGGTLISPTRTDGIVVFESGQSDSGGGPCGAQVGQGPCPSPHIGELISPAIDLTTTNAASYSARFYQFTRNFNSNYYLAWSYNDGVTWDSTLINTDLDADGVNFAEDNVLEIPLPGSGDASQVTLRFRWEADYYFWAIDDVQIIEQLANDMRVNRNFYAIAPNVFTPVTQTEPFPFLVDFENVGVAEQTNVNVNMSIIDTSLSEIFSTDLPYGTVAANELVENIPFDNQFIPMDVGTYAGIYSVTADAEDQDLSNNSVGFVFGITENLFAKETGPTTSILPAAANWGENEPHSWAYGNYFYVPNGDGFFVDSVSFSLGNPDEVTGLPVFISLYEWTEDTNGDFNMDPNERVQIASDFYVITGSEGFGVPINLPFSADAPVALKDDTEYVLMLEYFAQDQTDVRFMAADDLDYSAQVFASQITLNPRFSALLGIAGDLTQEPYSSAGFGRDIVPHVRMTIRNTATSTNDLKDITSEFAVFPNPTNEVINLQLGLEDQAELITVRISDVSGRTILQRDYENVQRETFNYNVSNLPGGTYFIQLTSETSTGTKRFVVNK